MSEDKIIRDDRGVPLESVPEPIDLIERIREREAEYDGFTCPKCACVYFNAQALLLREDFTVQGYMAPLACRDCGHEIASGAWMPQNMTVVKP